MDALIDKGIDDGSHGVIGKVFYTKGLKRLTMSKQDDNLTKVIAEVINKSKEPLETTEVLEMTVTKSGADVTRPVLFYRLNNLRAEGEIQGKQVGSGKGTWIWWGESITSGPHVKVEKR